MRSQPVQKLILENATPDRISALVDASPTRIRSWLQARVLMSRGGKVLYRKLSECC